MKLRVVIADDQPLMRTGFKTVLEATGTIEVVGEAGDGEEALRVAEALEPDVVLMDIQMPGSTGSRPPAGCRAGACSSSPPSGSTTTSSTRCAPEPAASCSRTRGRRSW